ncbi:hypothetical protein ACVRXS_07260 [Streptococcus orisratti]|uniref:hypothetical protein n=1 Tax=Streptococcus orisratti TaxID=114652 RepID=UPI0003A72BC0|nr:hypothetical protein [Streptococcus orisratti]
MKLKNFLSVILVITLGGLIIMTLSACGLNKDSREWIEKNRISDIYKVYPTKNPEDLFNIFTKGFNIEQYYKDEHNNEYKMHFTGNSDTKTINGELIKYYGDEEKKLADVSYRDGHLVFSDSTAKQYWPMDGFLFQHLTINQKKIDSLKVKDYHFEANSGIFHINYELTDSKVNKLLKKENQKITDFEITGSGKDYYGRTLIFTFDNGVDFSESIHKVKRGEE